LAEANLQRAMANAVLPAGSEAGGVMEPGAIARGAMQPPAAAWANGFRVQNSNLSIKANATNLR